MPGHKKLLVMDGVFVDGSAFERVFGRKLPERFLRWHIRITIEVVD